MNKTSTAPSYSYIMVHLMLLLVVYAEDYQIDTDFYLPVLMEKYFISTKSFTYAMNFLKYTYKKKL